MIRLAIAESHSILRWALEQALAKEADIEIVGVAANATDVLALIHRDRPELLILDADLPDHAGVDLLSEIRHLPSGPLVLVLGGYVEPFFAARAIAAGAHGYVGLHAEPAALLEAIRAVSNGDRVVPAGVDAVLAAGDRHPASPLTVREQQVMEMLGRGMTNREIAQDLEISIKTVDTHRGHILKKLGVRNNSELTRFAVKHGYVAL